MASLKQSGRFVLPDAMLAAIREEFDAGRADETETAAAIRAAWRGRPAGRSPYRGGACRRRPRHLDQRCPTSCCRPRIPGKFPDAVELTSACARRSGLARGPDDQAGAAHEKRPGRGRAVVAVGQPRCKAGGIPRGRRRDHQAPTGLTVVTDTMPHLETAALGVWTGAGGRDEKPNKHGISHMLEHMAFKGTANRSCARSSRRSRRSAASQCRHRRDQTAFHARMLKWPCRWRSTCIVDILTNPSFVQAELERERRWYCRSWARPGYPDDVVFEHLIELCDLQGPAIGWPILLGRAKTVKGFSRDMLRTYIASQYRLDGTTWSVRSGGHSVNPKHADQEVARRLASFNGRATAEAASGDIMWGQFSWSVVFWNRRICRLAFAGWPTGPDCRCSWPDLCHGAGRRHVFAAVPGSAGKTGTVLLDLRCAPPTPTPASSGFTPAPIRATRR